MGTYYGTTTTAWNISGGSQTSGSDILVISNPGGAPTITVLTRIMVGIYSSAAGPGQLSLVKKTGIPSGGTSTRITLAQANPNDSSPNTYAYSYTVPPGTAGTSTYVCSDWVNIPTAPKTVGGCGVMWAPSGGVILLNGQSVTLELAYTPVGTTYCLCSFEIVEL